jgi:hypothetical protein
MKREARTSSLPFTPELQARWEKAVAEAEAEKDEIIADALARREQRRRTAAQLTQTFQLLRDERERQGLSLSDIQERTGIDRSALSRLENADDPNPTIATLQRYAEALGKECIITLVDQT